MKNFCSLAPRGLQSECIAEFTRDRKTCGFYKKASYRDDCMHYVMNGFCDCVKAQIADTSIEEELVIEENQRLLFYEQC